jgi:uncharacterized glyoxalase superfamily metalloenzyme YdcJ
VFEAIGKFIHPTWYRKIVETESVNNLDLEEQQLVSEDQKHSSNVARVHYQKLRSREVALKGRSCMEKLRGDHGRAMDICIQQLRQQECNEIEVKYMETESEVRRRHLIQAKGRLKTTMKRCEKAGLKSGLYTRGGQLIP